MPVHPDLRDVADLLGVSAREAGEFCSEVAWYVSDRQITYRMIADVIDRHPRIDPTPELAAQWIMQQPIDEDVDPDAEYINMEYEHGRNKLNIIQQRDFRDAQAGFRKCPHGIPITQRCRICRPTD